MFQNITQKTSYFFNDFKLIKSMALSCSKKLSALLRGITSKLHGDFFCLNSLNSFATEKNVDLMKKYVKIKTFVTLQYLLKTLKY